VHEAADPPKSSPVPVDVEAGLGLLGGSAGAAGSIYGRPGFFAGANAVTENTPQPLQADFYGLEKLQAKPGSVEDRAFTATRELLEEQYGGKFPMYKIVYYMLEPGIEPVYFFKAQISETECIHGHIMRIISTFMMRAGCNEKIQLQAF
jgi:hypothetical protein